MDPKVDPKVTWKRMFCWVGFHDLKKHLYICERCGTKFRKSMIIGPSAPLYDPPKQR